MKRYSVAQARSRFSHLLDAAEAGDVVLIERRGTRFRLATDRTGKDAPRRRTRPPQPVIEYIDPVIMAGEWTWQWAAGGLQFAVRRKRR